MTLEQVAVRDTNTPHIQKSVYNFDSPNIEVVPQYLWRTGFRTPMDPKSQGCSRLLHKIAQINAYSWPSASTDLQLQVKTAGIYWNKCMQFKPVVFKGQQCLHLYCWVVRVLNMVFLWVLVLLLLYLRSHYLIQGRGPHEVLVHCRGSRCKVTRVASSHQWLQVSKMSTWPLYCASDALPVPRNI